MNERFPEITELARRFTDRELRPRWAAMDSPSEETLDVIFKALGKIQFFSQIIPETQDGKADSTVAAGEAFTKEHGEPPTDPVHGISACADFIAEVSRVSPAVGVMMASHVMGLSSFVTGLSSIQTDRSPIRSRETAEKAKRILAEIEAKESAGGIPNVTFCWMEDAVRTGTGLGLEEMSTTLEKSGKGFVLKGRKIYVPLARKSAYLVILSKTMDDHFAWACIPPDTAGIDVDDEKELMGLRLCPFHSVAFHDVSLRGENVLALGLSPRDILNDFIRFDACLGAIGVGMAQETYVKASHYAAERYQGGRMICDHDAVREMLSRMALNIEAGRSLVKEASMMADSEPVPPFHMWSSVASAETAVRAALDGIQILGGYGYMRDYGMERMLRDAKTFQNTVVLPHCRTQEFIKQEFHSLRQGK